MEVAAAPVRASMTYAGTRLTWHQEAHGQNQPRLNSISSVPREKKADLRQPKIP